MGSDNIYPNLGTLKGKNPLTKGWIVTSEPLGPQSVVTVSDFNPIGRLKVKVKLKKALPNTGYTIGLNVYGANSTIRFVHTAPWGISPLPQRPGILGLPANNVLD